MPDLRACFEEEGFDDVSTYIQSGNVVFGAPGGTASVIARRIERMLSKRFGYEASLVLRSARQMRAIVEGAPEGFGADRDLYRSDVVFLMPSITAAAALRQVQTREGVDRVWPGRGVLYFERLSSRATQSRLNKVASLPIYRSMTIRNWNTTTALLRVLEA
jgi:uncharacterized protein (DUF1697 family)